MSSTGVGDVDRTGGVCPAVMNIATATVGRARFLHSLMAVVIIVFNGVHPDLFVLNLSHGIFIGYTLEYIYIGT